MYVFGSLRLGRVLRFAGSLHLLLYFCCLLLLFSGTNRNRFFHANCQTKLISEIYFIFYVLIFKWNFRATVQFIRRKKTLTQCLSIFLLPRHIFWRNIFIRNIYRFCGTPFVKHCSNVLVYKFKLTVFHLKTITACGNIKKSTRTFVARNKSCLNSIYISLLIILICWFYFIDYNYSNIMQCWVLCSR